MFSSDKGGKIYQTASLCKPANRVGLLRSSCLGRHLQVVLKTPREAATSRW